MRRLLLAFAVVAVVVLVVGSGLAPASASASTSAGEVQVHVEFDTRRYPEVALLFDAPEGAIDTMTAVSVMEGGRPRPTRVQGGGNGGVEIALVVDTSASMAGAPLEAAKRTASEFVDRMPQGTRVAVVHYGDAPAVVSAMTSDAAQLKAAINGLEPGGDAGLYDALSLATDQFTAAEAPRSILLVSDGGGATGKATPQQVTAKLRKGMVRLFGVQLVTSEIDPTQLESAVELRAAFDGLAVASRGRTVDAGRGDGLPDAFASVTGEALRRVRVTYTSAAHGRTPVEIRLSKGAAAATMTLSVPLPRSSDLAPVFGGMALFLGILLVSLLTFLRPRRSLLASDLRKSGRAAQADRLHLEAMKGRAGELMEQRLERRGKRQALGVRLENAGIALRPGEYVVMTTTAAAVAMLTGVVLRSLGLGLVLVGLTFLTARLVVSSRTSKRRVHLERQLPDFLQQVTSSLRAGYGVMQAIDTVAREIPAPMSEELHRLVTEIQLGRELSDSLSAMAARVGGQDFEWVVQAIDINREVGGDLVEVLDAVANTIRARESLRRQVKTLSAQGRLSARILLAMPFVMAALLSALNPGYLAPFVDKSAGPVLLAIGGTLMLVGWLWLRRIVRPQF